MPLSGKSMAIVHEWFGAIGGSENVFLSIHEMFPQATGFILWRDKDARRGLEFRESWLARTPLPRSKALALPLMPLAWRTLSKEHFDIVISSSHAFAHTVKMGSPEVTRYLSYVHSPARYLWSTEHDARGNALFSPARGVLRRADVRLSRHVHSYAANSREVQSRIRRFWRREARVINPPVDVGYFAAAPASSRSQNRDYVLGVGRWIPYKNFDLMIQIADTAGVPLIIAGSGPEEVRLRRLARSVQVPVTFEVRPSRDRLRELYWGARALLFPTHEDFGIIPVEAMACGTPILGLRRGGLLETVIDGETGHLLGSTDPHHFASALAMTDRLDTGRISAHARHFSTEVFMANLAAWVSDET